MSITENLKEIKKSLPTSVTLVAVSKTKPNASIEEAFKHLKEHYTDFAPNQIAKIETYQIPQHYTEQELA